MPLEVGETSYITVAEADTYFQARLHSDAWTSATPEDKDTALQMATRAVDRQRFSGSKSNLTRVLAFPRRYLSVVQTQVPTAVAMATCEEALALLGRGNSDRRKLQQEGVIGFKIGNLSEQYAAGQTGKRVRPDSLLSQEAREMLSPYLLTRAEIV